MRGRALETVKRPTSKVLPRALEEGECWVHPKIAPRVDKESHRYASIGAVLISKGVADGVRDGSGL
jgi:hypothetical protein